MRSDVRPRGKYAKPRDHLHAGDQPTTLTDRLLMWLRARRYGRGITLSPCRRRRCLASGLLQAPSVRRTHLTAALVDAPPCRPSERRSARRSERSLGAAALDPERIVPPLLATVLPDVLQAEHDRRLAADPCAHGTWFPWALAAAQRRAARRAGGVPTSTAGPPGAGGRSRMLDTVHACDWHWMLRVPRDRRVLLQHGQGVTAQDLAQRHGAAHRERVLAGDEDARPTTSDPVTGWCACQVIGSWLPRAKEPWLLVTNLPLRHDAVQHYAQRWGSERQFTAWQSQGFHPEDLQRPTVSRVLTTLVIATWWTVGATITHLQPQLEHAAAAPSRPPCATRLPGSPNAAS